MVSRKKEIAKVAVEIFGEKYVIKGPEDPDYIQLLADRVDQKMHELSIKCPNLSVSKLAVLTAINLADELSKLQEDYDHLVNLLEEKKRLGSLEAEMGPRLRQSQAT
ncbi:MAG: cell division protein ZapA [Syntrophomonadaceae bacterium]|mgnify:CR=1 FL=1|nr:cell division protein ZapA [Syntrophomonadaceae bacterium]